MSTARQGRENLRVTTSKLFLTESRPSRIENSPALTVSLGAENGTQEPSILVTMEIPTDQVLAIIRSTREKSLPL